VALGEFEFSEGRLEQGLVLDAGNSEGTPQLGEPPTCLLDLAIEPGRIH
jgi:hypothetical protein